MVESQIWILDKTLNRGEGFKTSWQGKEISLQFVEKSIRVNVDEMSRVLFLNNLTTAVKFSIMPDFPDRPTVFIPDREMHIAPKTLSKFSFSISLPIILKIEPGFEKIPISIPIYKSTWLGEPTSGILAYNISSKIYFDLSEFKPSFPQDALLPVNVINSVDNVTIINKIAVFLSRLSLYNVSNNKLVFSKVRRKILNDNQMQALSSKYLPNSIAADGEVILAGDGDVSNIAPYIRIFAKPSAPLVRLST